MVTKEIFTLSRNVSEICLHVSAQDSALEPS